MTLRPPISPCLSLFASLQLVRLLARVSTFLLLSLICAASATAKVQFQLELPGENALHFSAIDGAAVLVPPGLYSVELGDVNTFVLTPEKGEGLTILAHPTVHDEQLFATSLLAEQTSSDEVHILLLFESGKGLDAVGSYSGVRSRAASRSQVLRAKKIAQAKLLAKQRALAAAAKRKTASSASRQTPDTNRVAVNNASLYQRFPQQIIKNLTKPIGGSAVLNPCTVSNPAVTNPKIVFKRAENFENRELFRMNSDGSAVTRFTDYSRGQGNEPLVSIGEATMSPDGTKIAFVMYKSEGNPPIQWAELYTVNINGTSPVLLSQGNRPVDTSPGWSPDGTKLVFTRIQGVGMSDLFTMNANGSNVTQLTNFPGFDKEARYSPDGTKILFTSTRDGNSEIYVMEADGSPGRVNLTNHDASDFEAEWCPTGAKITFTSDRDGDREIYIMNANGSGLTKLTNNNVWDGGAEWAPDGKKIAFHRLPLGLDPDPIEGIYLMNPDGSGLQHINQAPMSRGSFSMHPTW